MRFLAFVFLIGCVHHPVTPQPINPTDILSRTSSILHIAKDILPPETCIASESIASAIDIGVKASDKQTLPAIDLDISGCHFALTTTVSYLGHADYVDTALASALVALDALPDSCEKVWGLSVLTYTRGIYPEVVAEINSPDGIIHVPGVVVPVCNQ